ncbi:MAG: hypothetical protein VX727_06975 [Planctomycetota bacterium]|nr:hypothetical protein [Planctomycetota bacterium]
MSKQRHIWCTCGFCRTGLPSYTPCPQCGGLEVTEEAPPPPPPKCVCGYSRQGLAEDTPCPECGGLEVVQSLRHRIGAGMRDGPVGGKLAWCLGIVSLVLAGLLVIAFLLMLLAVLSANDGQAGIVLFLPILGYIYGVLPLAGLALLFAFVGFLQQDKVLSRYSLGVIAVAVLVPVLVLLLVLMLSRLFG